MCNRILQVSMVKKPIQPPSLNSSDESSESEESEPKAKWQKMHVNFRAAMST